MSEGQYQVCRLEGFEDQLLSLERKAGPYGVAAQRIYALLGRAGLGEDPFKGLKTTNHGESRIPNCVKYDLTGAVRLVTVHQKGVRILLFVGDHEDCDRWLKNNKSRKFTLNEANQIESTFVDMGDPGIKPGDSPLTAPGPLLDRLDASTADDLVAGLSRTVMRALDGLSAASSSQDVLDAAEGIHDEDQRVAVQDTMLLLLSGSIREAAVRANLYLEKVLGVEDFADFDIPDIVDSEFVKSVNHDHPRYGEVLKQFAKSGNYKSWMTFLHPDQEEIATHSFNGPAKLVGVSGSGKTCVVVKRAVELALRYPGEKVLVLTLNDPLAKLVDSLVDVCALPSQRKQIEVKPFFDVCRTLLLEFEPDRENHYRRVTWKGGEHIDEIWLEYYQCEANNNDAAVFSRVHDSLISQGYRADRYLRDEVDWVRSACEPSQRELYLEMQREGRALPLGQDSRTQVLKGLEGWERKMEFVGAADVLAVASRLVEYLNSIQPEYRCVLVDECQDFGNIELSIVRALVPPNENDLFMCGDAAQQVSSRYQSLRNAGIDVPGIRSRKLVRNYRNSKDILRASHEILSKNLNEEMIGREDFEVLNPEYSVFEGNLPLLLRAKDPSEEVQYALTYAQEYVARQSGSKACVVFAGFSLFEVENWASRLGFPVLNGKIGLDSGEIFFSDLEQTKGFEFDLMCITNCTSDHLPRSGDPESESHRDLSRLYVAMTRAKFELVLSYSVSPSRFFDGVDQYVAREDWADYVEKINPQFDGVDAPTSLESLREDGLSTVELGEMTGAQFLYTRHAVGLSTEVIAKIRELVDGRGLRRGADALKWRTMAQAARDFRDSPVSRRQWGSSVGRSFSELTLQLDL